MTKKEFIEKLKDMPDDAEVYFWDFNHDAWRIADPFYIKTKNEYSVNDEEINNFIGIE